MVTGRRIRRIARRALLGAGVIAPRRARPTNLVVVPRPGGVRPGRRALLVASRPEEGLAAREDEIIGELDAAQGSPQDLGGYYKPDAAKTDAAMRPSATLNEIIASI